MESLVGARCVGGGEEPVAEVIRSQGRTTTDKDPSLRPIYGEQWPPSAKVTLTLGHNDGSSYPASGHFQRLIRTAIATGRSPWQQAGVPLVWRRSRGRGRVSPGIIARYMMKVTTSWLLDPIQSHWIHIHMRWEMGNEWLHNLLWWCLHFITCHLADLKEL